MKISIISKAGAFPPYTRTCCTFANVCNTEYVAALILGVLVASVGALGLTQIALTRATFLESDALWRWLERVPTVVGLLGLGFLFYFFVPFIPSPALFGCSRGGVLGGLCLSNPGGLESLGYAVTGWGAGYGFEFGYFAPVIGIGFRGSVFTSEGVLMIVALPVTAGSLLMLAPRILRVLKTIVPRVLRLAS